MDTEKDNILEQSKIMKSPINLPVTHNNCSLTLICRHNKCLPWGLICFYFEFFLLLSELLHWRRHGRLEGYCFVLVVVRIAGQTLCHWTGLPATTTTMHFKDLRIVVFGLWRQGQRRAGISTMVALGPRCGNRLWAGSNPQLQESLLPHPRDVSFVTRWNPERLVVHTPKPWGNLPLLSMCIFLLH